jgi:HK97 family phage prohead protease
MRAAARRGIKLYEDGRAGDGLVQRTVDEARAMAAGNVTADKWVRIAAWIARHMPDLDAPKNSNRTDPEYPGPGLVAHLLWGSGPSKRQAARAMEYAKGVVDRLEAEDKRGNKMANRETRSFDADFEIREAGDGMTFSGYAAKFNSRSENLGGFVETIMPGAFKRSLDSRNDVKLLVNHDSGRVLASTRSGTLRLTEDSVGLRVEADLPNTTDGRDMAELLRRQDLSSMSFGFSVIKDSWSQDGTERSLKSVRLFETSIVAFPAYQATEASVRSYDALATRANVDADELADAILKLEEGEDLSDIEAELLKSVVEKLTPESAKAKDSVIEDESNNLELKRKQLELILKRV